MPLIFRRRIDLVTHRLDVLGTSLDLHIRTRVRGRQGEAFAREVEACVMGEILRLEGILSVHREGTEILRWTATPGRPVEVSPELAEVLEAAAWWADRTRGAFDPLAAPRGGGWEPARAGDTLPWTVTWDVPGERARAEHHLPVPFDPDGIAKGYILDRAVEAGYRLAPDSLDSILLNIGGDLRVLGSGRIELGIVDPFADAENHPPLATVRIGACGVATSGGYRRSVRRGGVDGSHIVDPGTGGSAAGAAGATVRAPTAMEADALATALCVLPPDEGCVLVRQVPDAGCLVVGMDRSVHRGGIWEEEGTLVMRDTDRR